MPCLPGGTWTKQQAFTLLGTFLGLAGFVLQFQGLRGLNWTASIAQLIAIFIMTILRAWVRRGLTVRPVANPVLDQHEMDWLALRIAKQADFWPGDDDPSEEPQCGGSEGRTQSEEDEKLLVWNIVTGARNFVSWHEPPEHGSSTINARKVVKIRQRLGHLAEWAGPVTSPAVSIATAIEAAMKMVFALESRDCPWYQFDPPAAAGPQRSIASPPTPEESSSEPSELVWSLKVQVGQEHGVVEYEHIDFVVWKNESGEWKADAAEIEAALSLWMFHLHDSENKDIERKNAQRKNKEPCDWLRLGDTTMGTRGSRVLGPDTKALRRDLSWWISGGIGQMIADIDDSEDAGQLTIGFIGFERDVPVSSKSNPWAPLAQPSV
jgi:hypothetical protein